MIHITGDPHSNFTKFNTHIFPEQKEMTKKDYVIITGDFGGVWYNETNKKIKEENYWLDWLEDKPFTTLFVDGNHENFDRLNALPKKEWNGGFVHEIRPSVLHLCRGEVFNLDGTKIFAFGGAQSHDISDGILNKDDPDIANKISNLKRQGKNMYRIKGLSWWEQELPSKEEMDNGIKNLKKYNNKVDYIITHSPPASAVALLGHGMYEQDVLTKYLEQIKINTEYRYWFSGHMHVNKQVNEKDIILYEQIIRIPTVQELTYNYENEKEN